MMGAHKDYDTTAENIKKYFLQQIEKLKEFPKEVLIQKRFQKYLNYGSYKEA
jgi:acetyl-CoA carboxylase carboxyl transferase subunit alpha